MIVACVLALATLASAPAEARQPGSGSPVDRLGPWRSGLELLHASRTDAAMESFLARKRERPDDPCSYYFPALVYLHFDVDGPSPAAEADLGRELIERGLDLASERLDSPDADPGSRYCAGALYALRAENRLRRNKYMGAAFDAKRSRRVMLDLLDDEPGCVDCRFWIGSYDYFADVLPGIIKFFRSLLFFPSGDRERGLATLAQVAAEGDVDRYNAMWMLYSIHSGLEYRPDLAREALLRVRAAYPEFVDARMALAWRAVLDLTPPDRERNCELHREALLHTERASDGVADRRAERVRLSLARALIHGLRPADAVEVLEPVLASTRGREERRMRAGIVAARALNHAGRHADALELLEELGERYPQSEWLDALRRTARTFDAPSSRAFHEIVEAWRVGLEDPSAGHARFRDLLDGGRPEGLVHFGRANLYLDLSRDEAALSLLRRAVDAGIDRPSHLTAFAHLRIGNLLDLRGERKAAKASYRSARKSAGEHRWLIDLAESYLDEPFDGKRPALFP